MMSDPVAIVSNIYLSHQTFHSFLAKLENVVLTPQDVFDGYLEDGKAHVWIAFCDSDCQDQFEEDATDVIAQNLGDQPKTRIIIEISRVDGSSRLAVELAIQFSKHWNAVLDNLHGTLYSINMLQLLLEKNQTNAILGVSFE